MCQDCPCSDGGTVQIYGDQHHHSGEMSEEVLNHHDHTNHDHTNHDHTNHDHTQLDHDHSHHDRPHQPLSAHTPNHPHRAVQTYTPPISANPTRTLTINQGILTKNDRLAERNRGYFLAKGVTVFNLLSSPGSGKTALLERTLRDLQPDYHLGVVVGDLETDNDAVRLRRSGAPAVQIVTGSLCHLEAGMILEASQQLDLEALDGLIIENVGNLVCPAAYDLGEDCRIALLSVTEGEDKPLKYPTLFKSIDLAIITKIDLAEAVEFDRDLARENLHRMAPQAQILEVSARTGEGLDIWYNYLKGALKTVRR